MKTLTDWLDHCERLHPKNIDLGLDRVRVVALRMGIRFDCPVFTVAGTKKTSLTLAERDKLKRRAKTFQNEIDHRPTNVETHQAH